MKPSVFFIEESKYKETGRLKIDNYIIFELNRQSRDGGGLALGCAKELQPVWLREGSSQVEAMSVEIYVKKMKIRCCIAYGPQENECVQNKEEFWKYIDEDVLQADASGSGFIMHFDGNLWAGEDIIPGDPRPQNRNGKLFKEFLDRNPHLYVVNALPLCEGLITRSRMKNGVLEQSVLDFFVVCTRVLPFITGMKIDEKKEFILTNYQNVRNGGAAVDSDHFTQFMDINLKFVSEKPQRNEIFNFKEKEAQMKFKRLTTETDAFTKCFLDETSILSQIKKWRETLAQFCKHSFKKIRIRKKNIKPLKKHISNLIDERNKLVS